jgi:hypothetical protein
MPKLQLPQADHSLFEENDIPMTARGDEGEKERLQLIGQFNRGPEIQTTRIKKNKTYNLKGKKGFITERNKQNVLPISVETKKIEKTVKKDSPKQRLRLLLTPFEGLALPPSTHRCFQGKVGLSKTRPSSTNFRPPSSTGGISQRKVGTSRERPLSTNFRPPSSTRGIAQGKVESSRERPSSSDFRSPSSTRETVSSPRVPSSIREIVLTPRLPIPTNGRLISPSRVISLSSPKLEVQSNLDEEKNRNIRKDSEENNKRGKLEMPPLKLDALQKHEEGGLTTSDNIPGAVAKKSFESSRIYTYDSFNIPAHVVYHKYPSQFKYTVQKEHNKRDDDGNMDYQNIKILNPGLSHIVSESSSFQLPFKLISTMSPQILRDYQSSSQSCSKK